MISLQSAADFIRTGRAIQALINILNLRRNKRIITFTDEHNNRPPRYIAVINAYRAGMPISNIEAKFGCSKTTIHRYARMAGLYRPKESSKRDQILAMYTAGKPIAEISARLGVSQALVSKTAGKAGLLRYRKSK